jgi:hypothetical protein
MEKKKLSYFLFWFSWSILMNSKTSNILFKVSNLIYSLEYHITFKIINNINFVFTSCHKHEKLQKQKQSQEHNKENKSQQLQA